jgi:hypothetical protein
MQTIALDCDGVILDYIECYKRLYNEFFNDNKKAVNPYSYTADIHLGIDWTHREKEQSAFYDYFGQNGWTSMKPISGAVEATKKIKEAGYKIVIVTSIPFDKANARHDNLLKEGVSFDDVIACGSHSTANGSNIKKPYLDKLAPQYFADDLLQNFSGVSDNINCVLIDWFCENNENFRKSENGIKVFSTHEKLIQFTDLHI